LNAHSLATVVVLPSFEIATPKIGVIKISHNIILIYPMARPATAMPWPRKLRFLRM
jgi:hypothetical protein